MKYSRSIHTFSYPTLFALALTVCAQACGDSESESESEPDGGVNAAAGDDSAGDDSAGDDSAEDNSTEDDSNEPSGAGGLDCYAINDVPANEYVDVEMIPGVCQHTVFRNPPSTDLYSADEACGFVSQLDGAGVFEVEFLGSVDAAEGLCESDGCVKQCVKQFRSEEGGTQIRIFDQGDFDITATLYEEAGLEDFENWCTEYITPGTLQDCE